MATILIVDDSAFARNHMKRSLGSRYDYLEAEDGLSGLEAYFLHKPDLVILDITMPGTNGLDVLEQIRRLDPAALVVICSADIQGYSHSRAEELGARAFVEKPVTLDNLGPVIEAILEGSGRG
jgi:two-component system, chemotaxis family, chemotaxis protein CheY